MEGFQVRERRASEGSKVTFLLMMFTSEECLKLFCLKRQKRNFLHENACQRPVHSLFFNKKQSYESRRGGSKKNGKLSKAIKKKHSEASN